MKIGLTSFEDHRGSYIETYNKNFFLENNIDVEFEITNLKRRVSDLESTIHQFLSQQTEGGRRGRSYRRKNKNKNKKTKRRKIL